MNKQPAVSVIVPVYKAENYLHRCIDSLLAQTFTDFELLLVDDGSPDRSGEICDEYAAKDSRVRVFHKENGGVSSARQYGIDNALGEYTIHADPDDWVEPEMLEELYQKAKQEDADMVICDFFVYNNNNIYVKQQPSSLYYRDVQSDLFRNLHGSCWNKLIKRSCLKRYDISFPVEISFCEDLFFNVNLLNYPLRISYLPNAYYHYVQNENVNSLVKMYDADTYKSDVKLLERLKKITIGTSSYKFCLRKMSYLIMFRMFKSGLFSSFNFTKKGINYCFYMLGSDEPLINRIVLFVSVLGFYKLLYCIIKK